MDVEKAAGVSSTKTTTDSSTNNAPNAEAVKGTFFAYVSRDAQVKDASVDEFRYSSLRQHATCPDDGFDSIHDSFDALEQARLTSNSHNFASHTSVECLEVTGERGHWRTVDDTSLPSLLSGASQSASPSTAPPPNSHQPRLLVFFAPLSPVSEASYGSQISISKKSISLLFSTLKLNPASLCNMIGRPDYWAPQMRCEVDDADRLQSFHLFCQHPRWNVAVQGAPLSVYMRYDAVQDLAVYVISHKPGDTSVGALRTIIDTAMANQSASKRQRAFLEDPFAIHILLCSLSFEASKHHIKAFQRLMWSQFNRVDDHLGGITASDDRAKLGDLTRQLHRVSQSSDMFAGAANVATYTASGIRDAHQRLHALLGRPARVSARGRDAIDFVIECMAKLNMWLDNYKSRKDSIMSLVYNLVTQQEAINSLQLSMDMKRDSTSMNSIAALTMIFLPGTFTATILGADIFSSEPGDYKILVSGIWWLWIATTIPLTLIVILCWWWYRTRNQSSFKMLSATFPKEDLKYDPDQWNFSVKKKQSTFPRRFGQSNKP